MQSPFEIFDAWLLEAENIGVVPANAATLSTITPNNKPSPRVVLINKAANSSEFVFYTNTTSNKGMHLASNPSASLCFYWKELGKQIVIEGNATIISNEAANIYFASRDRGKQIGAWASKQSQKLENYEFLTEEFQHYTKIFAGKNVDRPPYWSGFKIIPNYFEFLEMKENRLHVRKSYQLIDDIWNFSFLHP